MAREALPGTDVRRRKSISDILARTSPESYRGIFSRASENLGQDPRRQPGFEEFLTSGVGELADAFVDEYYRKTGELPDPALAQKFIGENLTPEYARKYMTGELPRDVVTARIVRPFLEFEELPVPEAEKAKQAEESKSLSQRVKDIYGTIESEESEGIRREFAPSVARAVESEAASGRLRSPVAAGRSSAIQVAREGERNALSNLISKLAQSRASGEFSAAQSESELAQRARELQKGLGLERHKLLETQRQFDVGEETKRQGLRLSEIIGRLQAQGRRPGTLDYLNTAFGGLGALGSLGIGYKAAFK